MGRDVLKTGTFVDGFLVREKLHVGGMASLWRVTRDDIDFPIVLNPHFPSKALISLS